MRWHMLSAERAPIMAACIRLNNPHLGAGVITPRDQERSIDPGEPVVFIDMSAVRTVDSCGLGALVALYRKTSPQRCILLHPKPAIALAISRARLDELFEFSSELDGISCHLDSLRSATEASVIPELPVNCKHEEELVH